MRGRIRGQGGGVITGGLVKTAFVLALIAVTLYDGGAVLVNAMQLDGIAGSTLRTAEQTWAQSSRLPAVEEAVLRRLEDEENVTLDELDVTADELVLVVSRPSRTLLAHRIPPLEPHVERTAAKRAELP